MLDVAGLCYWSSLPIYWILLYQYYNRPVHWPGSLVQARNNLNIEIRLTFLKAFLCEVLGSFLACLCRCRIDGIASGCLSYRIYLFTDLLFERGSELDPGISLALECAPLTKNKTEGSYRIESLLLLLLVYKSLQPMSRKLPPSSFE